MTDARPATSLAPWISRFRRLGGPEVRLSWRSVVAMPLLVYVLVVIGFFVFQRVFVFPRGGAMPVLADSGVVGAQEIRVETEDGLRLLAWYRPPPDTAAPTIIGFHGGAGTMTQRAGWFQLFARSGFGVLFVEYRGFGQTAGSPTQEGLFADARAAYRFARASGVPPNRIVLWGESLGTGVAVHLAAESEVGGVVLSMPYTSVADAAKHLHPYLPIDLLLEDRFESLSVIDRIHAPLLVGIAGKDAIVTPEEGRRLFAAAPAPKEKWEAPEAEHGDLLWDGFGPVVVDFIRRRVSGPSLLPAQ